MLIFSTIYNPVCLMSESVVTFPSQLHFISKFYQTCMLLSGCDKCFYTLMMQLNWWEFANRNNVNNNRDVLARLDILFEQNKTQLHSQISNFSDLKALTDCTTQNYLLNDALVQDLSVGMLLNCTIHVYIHQPAC